AAELPRAELALERRSDRAAVLDREVRNAAPRIEDIRRSERPCRAGVETGAAGAAAVGERLVEVERGRGQQHADQEPRAQVRVEQHGVLADPAQPRPRGEITLENGARVDVSLADR